MHYRVLLQGALARAFRRTGDHKSGGSEAISITPENSITRGNQDHESKPSTLPADPADFGNGSLADSRSLCRSPQVQTEFGLAIDIQPLREIENRVLPPCLTAGPNRYDNLPAYYAAENRELAAYFADAQQRYENQPKDPYRSMAMVAGAAGVGKTFIKGQVFKKSYAEGDVCKFDIKELYQEWRDDGLTEEKPDLFCGDVVLNRLLGVKASEKTHQHLLKFLQQQSAAFYVIDSLDELHPDDYLWVLQQVEEFLATTDQPFCQVVLFGRGLAFREYWQSRVVSAGKSNLKLFLLNPPVFKTTGDLLVSSWNYDVYRYKLNWSPQGGEPETMPLEAYRRWVDAGYRHTDEFATVSHLANDSMNAKTRDLLNDWCQHHRDVGPMIYNLAGNGILREIVEDYSTHDRPFNQRKILEDYFTAWLNRDAKSSNRPSASNPEHLELYLQLLQEVAAKYLVENRLDSDGFFPVQPEDAITLNWQGETLQFPVTRILNRSGLKYIDPREPGPPKYRFEPIWLQRQLIEMRSDRSSKQFSKK